MPYVTSVERIGEMRGLLSGIETALKIRFRDESSSLLGEIRDIWDIDKLRTILQAIETVNSIEELRNLVAQEHGGEDVS